MSFKKNITRLSLYFLSLIFCFIKMFEITQWKNGTVVWRDLSSVVGELNLSLGFHPAFHSTAKFLLILFLIALILNIVLLVIELARKTRFGNKAVQIALNCFPLVCFAAATASLCSGSSMIPSESAFYSYTGDFTALFYVFAIIQIANLVLLFVRFPDAEE